MMELLEEVARGSPKEILKLLRGPDTSGPPPWPCWCGRPLIPCLDKDGNRIGVTHELAEDDDWHYGYDASLRIAIPAAALAAEEKP